MVGLLLLYSYSMEGVIVLQIKIFSNIKRTRQFVDVTFCFRDVNYYEHVDLGVKCLCCDICSVNCNCGKCVENHSFFEFIGKS